MEFANKCWRIIRVGGDGSVKLILHNDNFYKVTNPCSRANNSNYAAFARYSGATYESAFNEKEDDNAYVGFMYGTAGSLDYATTHANTNKSTILTNLETWYNNNLILYESEIDDNVFCTDKTNITDTSYDPVLYGGTPTGLGFGKNKTIYAAMQRLVGTDKKAGGTGPSLKCNGELSKITSKIGLITVDELAFAGYAYKLKNTTTYLQENASNYWWSLTPGDFSTDEAYVGRVDDYTGSIHFASVSYSRVGVRPVISLVSLITISGGSGTSEDPYVVN